MQFRFSPRQLGLYGRKKGGGESGKVDEYKRKDAVTEAEVSRTMNSTVTPYRHKSGNFDSLPAGEKWSGAEPPQGENGGINRDAEIRMGAAMSMAKTDAAAPERYSHEADMAPRLAEAPLKRGERPDMRPWDENRALGTDENGATVFEEDIIAMIKDELERRRQERLPLELQWQLNSNFYDGNQYCDINPGVMEVLQRPECYGEEGNSREVFNRIAPLIETRIANLKKINYAMEVRPATNEADDYHKARVATAALRHTQDISGFNAKKDTLILWNELCGSCFWLTWWDPEKGEPYVRVKESRADGEGGVKTVERTIFEGDVDYGLLTPYEVYPESIFKQTVADQGSIIIEQVRTVKEIKRLYGRSVEGEDVETFTLTPTPAAGGLGYEATVISMGKSKMHGCKRVATYFERRSEQYPRGRMAVLIGDDDLAYYGPLPTDDIPIVRTVCKERAGQFFGKSVIEELIPLQRAYNTACNDILDYLKKAKSCQYIVFEGTVDMDDFEEQAGKADGIIVYRSMPDVPPARMPALAFSGDVFTQKRDLEGQMEYVAAVSQLMVYGQTPTGVTSGTAIESLRDIDNTRLALTGDYIRNSVAELARLWLGMYKKYAGTYRIIRYTGGNDLGSALVWSGEDITSYDVEFSTENELMTSENTQWQRVMELLQAGLADQSLVDEAAEKAREFIKSGKYNAEQTVNELQTQAAVRENALLERGALPEISDYDNHRIHAEEHLKYILQTDFLTMKAEKPRMAEAMVEHWKKHMSVLQQNQMAAARENARG